MPWLDYAPDLVRLMEAEAQRIEKTTPPTTTPWATSFSRLARSLLYA